MHLAINFYRPNTLALNGAEIAFSLTIIMVFSDVFLESLLKGVKRKCCKLQTHLSLMLSITHQHILEESR